MPAAKRVSSPKEVNATAKAKKVDLAAVVEGGNYSRSPKGSAVHGLQFDIDRAFSKPEMAHSEITPGAFALGIGGALTLSLLVWVVGIGALLKIFL